MSHPDEEARPPRARRTDPDDDDFEDDRPRRRRDDFEPTELIIPTGVSAYSIVALYAGLIGMCLPLFGLVFTIPALVCAIIALRRRKQAASYGAVTSDVRAIVGLVFCGIGLIFHTGMLLLAVIDQLQ